jgi:hypothetical protein
VTYVDFYVHLKTDDEVQFYAQFDKDIGGVETSLSHGNDTEKSVKLQGLYMPPVGSEDYQLVRERVWNGEGKIDGDDEFSYMLQSIDFWRLTFRKSGFDEMGFATMSIEANASTFQWESELLDETFFSFTSWAFRGKSRVDEPEPKTLFYDSYLGRFMDEVGHARPDTSLHNRPPSPGQLVIALHREDDVPYWYDGMADDHRLKQFRKVLDKPVIYVFRDENGNRHRVQIGFDDPTSPDSRNRLVYLPV